MLKEGYRADGLESVTVTVRLQAAEDPRNGELVYGVLIGEAVRSTPTLSNAAKLLIVEIEKLMRCFGPKPN